MARRIAATVKPNAKKSEVVEQSANQYRVSVRAAAQDGKANRELIAQLHEVGRHAEDAGRIAHGHSARRKIIDID